MASARVAQRVVLGNVDDPETRCLLARYAELLGLPTHCLRVTSQRSTFESWLGRRVSASIGGAYVFLPARGEHAILVNLARIDRCRPRALEIVVAEELLHMRDFLDGDFRRHAKHGDDRIARRVAALTGASPEEVRSCLLPVRRRPYRYLYACPACGVRIPRRVRGDWSCKRCSPTYETRYRLRLVDDFSLPPEANSA
jgi:hypothetical protein